MNWNPNLILLQEILRFVNIFALETAGAGKLLPRCQRRRTFQQSLFSFFLNKVLNIFFRCQPGALIKNQNSFPVCLAA